MKKVDPVELQLFVNRLAKTHSGSLVKRVRSSLRSILLEAVEQDYRRKSPARLLRITQSIYRGKLRPYTKTTDQDSKQSLQTYDRRSGRQGVLSVIACYIN